MVGFTKKVFSELCLIIKSRVNKIPLGDLHVSFMVKDYKYTFYIINCKH